MKWARLTWDHRFLQMMCFLCIPSLWILLLVIDVLSNSACNCCYNCQNIVSIIVVFIFLSRMKCFYRIQFVHKMLCVLTCQWQIFLLAKMAFSIYTVSNFVFWSSLANKLELWHIVYIMQQITNPLIYTWLTDSNFLG